MDRTLQKTLWVEGILLGQQHFQQWDLYLEEQQRWRMKMTAAYAWGLQNIVIDESALLNGKFRIKKLRGILPNSQLISYDDRDNEPLSCEISSQTGEIISIYLCLPIGVQITGITGYQNGMSLSAWKAIYKQVADLYDIDRQREVLFGQLQLVLLSKNEALAAYDYFKIAEVKNNQRGEYELIKSFIPPLLDVHASAYLADMVTDWVELLGATIRFIKNNSREIKGASGSFTQSDLENFLLLQTLSYNFPTINHFRHSQSIHPQQLYLKVLELLAGLGNFYQEFSLEQLPEYRHENLTTVFSELNTLLKFSLDAVMPTRFAPMQLRRENESLYVVNNIDGMLFSKNQFFIAVFFPSTDTEWIGQFARQIKVGSASGIDSIVTSALPGVKITHKQRPPNKLAIKTGYEYFYLEPHGQFWEQIVTEKNLAIFVPANFINATIDLITVQD